MQKRIITACGGAVALGAVLWLWSLPWMARNDAVLAALEPASGAAAPPSEEHGGSAKKSHSGKTLSDTRLPTVTVGGLTVLSAKELTAEERASDLGEEANNSALNFKLQQQRRVKSYAHNPARGELNALVEVYEFSDLGCVQCMNYLEKIDELVEPHKTAVRHTQIHTPVSQFQDTNLAAFYGKVAQRGGKFWDYRKALQTLEEATPEKYFETLIATGMDRVQARQILNSEARRLYRELDADSVLAKSVGVGEPPAFVINGTLVGDQGVGRDQLATVFTYQYRQAQRREELARLNQGASEGRSDE